MKSYKYTFGSDQHAGGGLSNLKKNRITSRKRAFDLHVHCLHAGASRRGHLHDLVLCDARSRFCVLHCIAPICVLVLDIRKTKGTPAVLVAGEFRCVRSASGCFNHSSLSPTDCSLGILRRIELDDPGAPRATVGFILNLRTFDFSDGGEKFHEIFVACRPR